MSGNEDSGKQECFERFKSDLYRLNEEEFTSYYSIKLSVLDYDFNLFLRLLEVARECNIRLHIDSLNPESAPTVFQFFKRTSAYNDILGCTLPSRWKRSLKDAERAVDLGLSVRIVKGQWKDPQHKVNSRDNYLAIIKKLSGRARSVGVATHDIPLADKALGLLSGTDTHYELEQFFSLPLNGMDLADRYDCPYRLYVAYGAPAIPYNYRFALTRPSLAAWLVTDFVFKSSKPWMENGV
jgi:proline dehydrogenase